MTDYTISCKLSNETVYACYRGRFWRWDGSIWKESHLMTQKFERAKAADKKLTPQAFLTNGAEFAPLDEYELPEQMLTALREAKPCRNAPIEPAEEHPTPSAQCSDAATAAKSQTAASPAAPEGSIPTTETADAVSGSDAPGNATGKNAAPSAGSGSSLSNPAAPTFDFGADDQTNALLLQDAQTFIVSTTARIMAAKHAHDLCANNKNGTWGKWCATVGISRDTGDRLVNIAAQCGNIQLEGKSILDVQPLKLLYAAAKPSTPEVVKQAVFTGDITTYKEYQELLAQLKAKEYKLNETQARLKSACIQEQESRNAMNTANAQLEAANADIKGLTEQNDQLRSRLDAAEAREEEAWKMQTKAEARAKNAEDALKKQPIVGVTDPEEVRRQADALAAEAKAQARRQIEDAQRRAREAEARYQKLQQDADGFLAPEQSCAQQAKIIADSMRSMYLGWFGLASTTGTPLARMAAPIYQVCDEIRESLEEDTTINPTAEGSVEDAEREALFE